MEEKNVEFTLSDLLDIVVPKLWIIALISVLVSAAFGAYSHFFVEDTYTSSVEFYLYSGSPDSPSLSEAQKLVPVYTKAYKSDTFCKKLKEKVSQEYPDYSNYSEGALKGMMSFSEDSSVAVFDIVVTSGDPNLSAAVAQCILELSYAPDSPERPLIQSLVPHSAELALYRSPSVASAPNDKNVTRNIIVSFFAAAIVSFAFVIVLSMLDVTIRDKKKLENGVSVPVLGVIPRYEIISKMEGKKNDKA